MNKINALVIDDEFLNRDLISQMILKINPVFNVLDTAGNINDAYDLILKHSPDLIFLDIKMPGGSGFDLLKRFENPEFEVVFITGFDEYAIKAFEFNALDYILKPIDISKLKVTLEKTQAKIYNKLSVPGNLKRILSTYNNSTTISKIPVHDKDKVVLLDLHEIISIVSVDGYTKFQVFNSKQYMSSKQLVSFEFIIDSHENFIRISKSVYININFIKNYSKGANCIISLIDGSSHEVSRRKKTEILMILDKNNK